MGPAEGAKGTKRTRGNRSEKDIWFRTDAAFLLTVGGFLLTVELLCLHLCFGASLLTVGAFLLTVGVFFAYR